MPPMLLVWLAAHELALHMSWMRPRQAEVEVWILRRVARYAR